MNGYQEFMNMIEKLAATPMSSIHNTSLVVEGCHLIFKNDIISY